MSRLSGDWLTRAATQAVFAALAPDPAWFVGGCVRDALAARPVGDIDIATVLHPETVMARARAAGLAAHPTGIAHGTVTVVSQSVPHEVTTLRRDVATDGRRATVAFSDRIEEDAARRDFTMNALYATPEGEVLDPLGGLEDLLSGRVRFVGDPETRIREDYLRILRFFRFRAWYGAPATGPDSEALAAIAANVEGLDRLSGERVTGELRRLLAAPDPAPPLASMATSGVLARVLPGADPSSIAVLVLFEEERGMAPDWLRRLAGLTAEAPRLTLTRAEARRFGLLRDGVGSETGAAELGYRLGEGDARDILLLRAALTGQRVGRGVLDAARHGAAAQFPVRAADLMPALDGEALGRRLAALEAAWIASGFALDRDALLAGTAETAPDRR